MPDVLNVNIHPPKSRIPAGTRWTLVLAIWRWFSPHLFTVGRPFLALLSLPPSTPLIAIPRDTPRKYRTGLGRCVLHPAVPSQCLLLAILKATSPTCLKASASQSPLLVCMTSLQGGIYGDSFQEFFTFSKKKKYVTYFWL